MTCKTFFTASLLLAAVFLFGQNAALGIRIGYTSSTAALKKGDAVIAEFSIPTDSSFGRIRSIHLGADARIPLGDRFALVAGLQYSRRGFLQKRLDFGAGTIPELTYHLHYITMPILGDFTVWNGLAIQAGLEPAVLIGARGEFEGSSFELGGSDQIERLDLGLIAGLEWRLGLGIFIGGRQIWGLRPFQDIEITDQIGAEIGLDRYYTRAWQVSAGYRYSLK